MFTHFDVVMVVNSSKVELSERIVFREGVLSRRTADAWFKIGRVGEVVAVDDLFVSIADWAEKYGTVSESNCFAEIIIFDKRTKGFTWEFSFDTSSV